MKVTCFRLLETCQEMKGEIDDAILSGNFSSYLLLFNCLNHVRTFIYYLVIPRMLFIISVVNVTKWFNKYTTKDNLLICS